MFEKLKIIIVVVLLCNTSCDFLSNSSSLKKKDKADQFPLTILDTIITDKLKIRILGDEKQNLLILLEDDKKYLYASAGVGFSEFFSISDIQLMDKTQQEYLIRTSVIGSTYGAETNFIIWNNGIIWNITKANFQRAHFKDIDKDGIFELIEEYNPIGNQKEIYSFDAGNFLKFENDISTKK